MDALEVMTLLLKVGIQSDSCLSTDWGNVEWRDVEKLALKHNVLPLVFDGYKILYDERANKIDFPIPHSIMLRWYGLTLQAEKQYAKQLSVIKELACFFEEHQISTMVLKGYALSLLFPIPSHRLSGDVDIYQYGAYKNADILIHSKLGIKVDRQHHHHTIYWFKGIMVENHYDFMNVQNHVTHKIADKILKKIAIKEESFVSEDGILLPSPNLNVLFTLIHTGEHFVCESIDYRRLCDWWLLKQSLKEKADWHLINQICEELGILRFMKILDSVADYVLGGLSKTLDKTSQKVLNEIIHPDFEQSLPKGRMSVLCFKLRRWWKGRWKMKLVYGNENLWMQFVMHLWSHVLRPSNMFH